MSQSSVAWSTDSSNQFFTGGSDGKIYQWNQSAIAGTTANSKGSVHSISMCETTLVAGGQDKTINLYSIKS